MRTQGKFHVGSGNGEGNIFADGDVRMRLETGKGSTLYPIASFRMGFNEEEDNSNGHLLAASPDLLEVLEIEEEAESDLAAGLTPRYDQEEIRSLRKLAIAKATDPNFKPNYGSGSLLLTCSWCGGSTMGRQWWNRDTGYGLCVICITLNPEADMPRGHVSRGFGKRGYHYDLIPVDPNR